MFRPPSQKLVYFWLLTFTAAEMKEFCSKVELIRRDQWNARLPKDYESMKIPVPFVFIHHTAMPECFDLSSCKEEVKKIQDLHMNTNNWSDIGYNFLVGEDRRVYEARGWNRTGAHTKYYNNVSIAISVMGNYMSRLPRPTALKAVQNMIACGVQKGYIVRNYKLFAHRDVRETLSPGDALYERIKQWPHYSHNPPNLHQESNLAQSSSSLSILSTSKKLVIHVTLLHISLAFFN
nr:peptidoglycan recognition protein 3 [Sepioteuthis lessoniana]